MVKFMRHLIKAMILCGQVFDSWREVLKNPCLQEMRPQRSEAVKEDHDY
jgi:hypothetical protein